MSDPFDPSVPGDFTPVGYDQTVVNDLDIDLVAFILSNCQITPSPMIVSPGPQRPITCTYSLVSEVAVGRLKGMAGLAQRIYQLDFRSTEPGRALDYAERVRLSIQGFRGPMGTNTVRQATFKRIPNLWTTAVNGGSSGTYRVAVEVAIWFRQVKPNT